MPPIDQPIENHATMSFGDHLEELRTRVILSLLFPIPLFFVAWFFSGDLLKLICEPLYRALRAEGLNDQLQVLAPPEALLTQIKVSLLAAVIVSAPWLVWQAWLFVRPGLYRTERRFVYFLIPGSAILTVCGVALLYFVMLPLVLVVLVGFGSGLDDEMSIEKLTEQTSQIDPDTIPMVPILAHPPSRLEPGMYWVSTDHALLFVVPAERGYDPAKPELDEQGNPIPPELEIRRLQLLKTTTLAQEFRLTTYVNFVLILTLGMVIAFQTPLVILLLGWLDLARLDWLRSNRKYALLGAGILGAVLTPADPWSMLAMMIPLYVLFEVGILLLHFFPASRVAGSDHVRRRDRDVKPAATDNTADDFTRSDQTEGFPTDGTVSQGDPDDSSDIDGEAKDE